MDIVVTSEVSFVSCLTTWQDDQAARNKYQVGCGVNVLI